MIILPAILINSLLRRNRKVENRKIMEKDSEVIKKLDQMEFFDAIEYLYKLKK